MRSSWYPVYEKRGGACDERQKNLSLFYGFFVNLSVKKKQRYAGFYFK